MIVTIISSVVMSGIVGTSYYYQKGGGTNDHQKIVKISTNAGLFIKEDGEKRTLQIYRKTQHDGYTEYAYRLPLGLSFDDFNAKRKVFEDGLNNKRMVISLQDLKTIDLKKNIIKQIKAILEHKQLERKEIEMSYDGMLKIKVFTDQLPEYVPYSEFESHCTKWRVPIGKTRDKQYLTHNFDSVAPHLIVGGTTRYGKTVWLKSLITTLIKNNPEHVTFTLVDLKGGLAFSRFKDLKQVRFFAKDEETANEVLTTLKEELDDKLTDYFDKGWEDIHESKTKHRHFVIVDEGAELSSKSTTDREEKKERRESENVLETIARRGAGVGYRLVYCTQYPTVETVSTQLRANCIARLCFRVKNGTISKVILDSIGAEELPAIPGRAIYCESLENNTVQAPFIDNDYIDKVIKPHVVIRSKPENKVEVTDGQQKDAKRTKNREDIIIIKKT